MPQIDMDAPAQAVCTKCDLNTNYFPIGTENFKCLRLDFVFIGLF